MYKHIFGYQENAKFIIDLLEEFFKVAKGTFKGSKILNSVKLNKKNINIKGFELDILVEIPSGEKVIVEMYNNYDINAETKSLMYVTNKFASQLMKGENYKEVKNVIILNFVRGDKIHKGSNVRKYTILNEENSNDHVAPNLFQFYIIDVDSEVESIYNISERFKKWTAFINASTKEEVLKIIKGDEIMEEAYEEMEDFTKNEHWGTGYFHPSRLIRSQINTELEEVAKKLIKLGMSDDDIISVVNLTHEELEKIKKADNPPYVLDIAKK